ncbi:Tetratricopeptide repeat-containing protein [Catalinimonas alkaloidigena]|uniref:Tetratricopeptide repeat-containing protein n=1 Tax=Catalinimonas alkaloidigena TaxID=1075417 RepID=A0A1G9DVY4_9BACT|nr:tetratricopeptide repeat protein [Catalinimonas alkaloidigena]SDK68019.1 Tetratricopeptide repeat-containing protein [Catalinimonas alkaloidigena]
MARTKALLLSSLLTILSIVVTPVYAQKNRQKKSGETSVAYDQRDSEEYFMEGMKQYMLGTYDRALSFFEKALKLTPDNAAIHYMIGETKARQGAFDEAILSAAKALELDEENAYYYVLLAQLYEKNEMVPEALKVYQRLTKKFPEEGEYYFPLAAGYLFQGKYDEALKAYEKIQKIYGINEEIIRQKQQIYLRQNKLDEAIAESRKLIEAFPDEPTYVVSLAEMLVANDKYQEAADLLEKLTTQSSESPPRVRLILAEIYKSEGNNKAYLEQIKEGFSDPDLDIDYKIRVLVGYLDKLESDQDKEEALTLGKVTVETHPDDPKSYAMYGDLLSLSGNFREARDNYVLSTKLDNTKYNVWEQIIRLDHEKLHEFDSLAAHADAALELFPNQAIFWFYSGLGNYLSQNVRKARASLEQSKKLVAGDSPIRVPVHQLLGDIYQEMEEFDKSAQEYEAVLAVDPNNATVLNNYSYYLSLRKEKLDKARSMGKKLVEEHPNDATYLDTYGWVLYVSGDYKNARTYLEKAAKNTNSGIIVEHYGDVLFKTGETQEAVTQWKRAKKLGGELTEQIDRKIADGKLYE